MRIGPNYQCMTGGLPMIVRARSIDRAWLDRNGFWPQGEFAGVVRNYVSWGAAGVLLMLLATVVTDHSSGQYLRMAASEGLGPTLWNVFGTAGMMFFGVFLMLPGLGGMAYLANQLLSGTHSLGTFMTGLILGGFLVQVPAMLADYGWGWLSIWTAVLTVGLSICVLMNFFVWYMGWLVKQQGPFLNWLSGVGMRYRIPVGVFFVLMPLVSLITQKV